MPKRRRDDRKTESGSENCPTKQEGFDAKTREIFSKLGLEPDGDPDTDDLPGLLATCFAFFELNGCAPFHALRALAVLTASRRVGTEPIDGPHDGRDPHEPVPVPW